MRQRYQHIIPFFGPMWAIGRSGELIYIKNIIFTAYYEPCLTDLLFTVSDDVDHQTSIFLTSVSPAYYDSIDLGEGDQSAIWLRDEFFRLSNELAEDGKGGQWHRLAGYYRLVPVDKPKGWGRLDDVTYRRMLRQAKKGDLEAARITWKGFCRRQAQQDFHPGRKRSNGATMRKISTTAERRQNAGDVADLGQSIVRGARRHLPDAWWDILRGRDASWKHVKVRKQWMKRYK